MSLLLEALKKAEKAKEEAQRRARGDQAAPSELSIEGDAPAPPQAAPAADPKHAMTRDELPDISQPLEIVSDDLAQKDSRREPAPAPASAPAAKPPPAARAAAEERTPRPDRQASDRAAAKKVFEAKFKEPNPRMSFYITMGVLGLFAVGTAGYFWYQLRPPPGLINANPPRPGGEAVVAAAETAAPLKPVAAQAPIPGLPGSAALPSPTPAPAARIPAAASSPTETVAVPKPAARPLTASPARLIPDSPLVGAERSTALTVARPLPQVHAKVESGYAAYLAGDLAAARADYQEVLREEPTNRDALLGLAAVDMRSGRYEPAEAIYLRLLQSDPRDAHAHAALIALRAGRMDPVAAESRVKSLLANDPAADVLYFTLGNQLALQGRWAEAQPHYFKAFAADPDNADFAYNLAVSLDHLRQSRLALEYYRRAITLAEKRGGSFELAAARSRVQQLGR